MADAPGSTSHRRYFATFAKLAYDPQSITIPEGWERDDSLSNRNRSVYINRQTKQAILALSGTRLKSTHAAGDVGTDVLLALNMREFSSRFRNALRTAKQTRKKYSDYELTSVGHSAGASQAAFVHSKLRDTKAVTFASHTPTGDVANQAIENLMGKKTRKRDIVNYTVATDPINLGTVISGNNYTVAKTAKGSHDLANYLA